jgi:nicotinate phosphoribosyltransferase
MKKEQGTFSKSLFAAFYQLTMAQAYWQNDRIGESTFSLFIRRFSPSRGYMVFAGLEDILDHLQSFRFNSTDIDYLRSLNHFENEFLDYLSELKFTGQVRSIQEGTIFFPNEPVLEITAPLIEGQIIENYLLNRVNLETLLATKAARSIYAAKGRTISEVGSRRSHGIDSADSLVRIGKIVGIASTGNLHGAAKHSQKISGTMAHSFITSFDSELEAFRAFARSFPDESTFLVDTFDTEQGTQNAIQVAQEMLKNGHHLNGVRLDSGDFGSISKEVRKMLDDAGLPQVKIIVSGDLDEHIINQLVESNAPIDSFGIGTKMATSSDSPAIDCVYKLVEYKNKPVMKLSKGKETLAGRKQVFRFTRDNGANDKDVLALDDEDKTQYFGGHPLLETVLAKGHITRPHPTLNNLHEHFLNEFSAIADGYKSLDVPEIYPVTQSAALIKLQEATLNQIENVKTI